MPKYMTDISAANLLHSWQQADLVSQPQLLELESFILTQQQELEFPLYLRILVGIGAFIASLCFIGFLTIAEIIDFSSEAERIVWGLIFIGLALFLAKNTGDHHNTIKHSFFIQTAFCMMGLGKILFVAGVADMFGSAEEWGITIAISLITLATYPVFQMSIDRFLSSLAIFTSLLFNITDIGNEVLLNLFFLFQLAAAGWLLTSGKIKRDYIPLAYAVTFSLCITIIYFAIQAKIGSWHNEQIFSLIFVNVALMAALISLIGWAAGSLEKLQSEPLLLACAGAVLLAIISAPGILLSVCLLILGYAKHEKLLLLMGVLLMPAFIIFYYYNLDISLMAKSGVLVGSGVVLLLGRSYLAVKQLDREA